MCGIPLWRLPFGFGFCPLSGFGPCALSPGPTRGQARPPAYPLPIRPRKMEEEEAEVKTEKGQRGGQGKIKIGAPPSLSRFPLLFLFFVLLLSFLNLGHGSPEADGGKGKGAKREIEERRESSIPFRARLTNTGHEELSLSQKPRLQREKFNV